MSEKRIPRAEYPRPQWKRPEWETLNGEWEYETDRASSGNDRGLYKAESLPERIIVPFCRESRLSGIGDTEFCDCAWYRRTVKMDAAKLEGHVVLHIGASDYRTTVWVNGKWCGEHIGGYTSFEFDITAALRDGDNNIVIRVIDLLRQRLQPCGKQCQRYYSAGCSYTRTTGIWQSVWLEYLPLVYIANAKYYPDITDSRLTVQVRTVGGEGMKVTAEATYEGRPVGHGEATVSGGVCSFDIKLGELHLWEIGHGRLYGLTLTMGEDKVESYFGMRTVSVRDGAVVLNGKKIFQRLVLDQGFYPDGIYTAQTEEELYADIERSLGMGFNGARLHQKIFEPEFIAECDRRGYIVWGEHGNWGLDVSNPAAYLPFASEWLESVERDFNSPAIIGWCPINETSPSQLRDFAHGIAALTRSLDPTRAYIDASGWTHIGESDIYDLHCYEQDPEKFAQIMAPVAKGEKIQYRPTQRSYGEGLPTFISEYGGVRRASDSSVGWGYGETPQSDDELIERLRGLTKAICDNPAMTGYCYTQLTDVEQEMNGLYTYDRKPKFDTKVLSEIFGQPAAMEKQ